MITVDIFKDQIGSVQNKISFDTIKPFIKTAERWFKGQIGPDLFAYLKGLTNPAADSDEAELLDLAQACLCWYAYDLAFPHLKLRVGDQGMMKTTPQSQVAVTKWEYVDSREANLQMVDLMQENFWALLQEMQPSAWTESTAYAERCRYFIRSATELGSFVSLVGRNSRFFQQLLPYIRRAEDFYIKPLLTAELFNQVKAAWQDTDALPGHTASLIEAIQPAVAHLALFEAYPYLPLRVDQEGIRQSRSKDGVREEEFPEAGLRKAQRLQLQLDGETYLAEVRRYLDSMSSTTIFVPYYNYQQTNQTEPDDFTGKPHILL